MPVHFVWIAYSVSNLVALLLLWACWKKPALGRLLFFLLFAAAACFNTKMALTAPDLYLGYAQFAILDGYRVFILGFFAQHTTLIVLLIAAGQAGIALGMLARAGLFRLGILGGMLFLLSIAPLGAGAAFPSTIILAAGLCALWQEGSRDWLWKLWFSGTSPKPVDSPHTVPHV